MSTVQTFEVAGVAFEAVRHFRPCPHWRLRLKETGQEFEPGSGGVSNVSVPKMKTDVQELFDRVSKGDVADFRRRWGLPPKASA